MKEAFTKLLRDALDAVNDEMIPRLQKSAKLIENRGVKITLCEKAVVKISGVAEYTREGSWRVSARAGAPALGAAGIDATVSAGADRGFEAEGSANIEVIDEVEIRLDC